MTDREAQAAIARRWLAMARDSLAAAKDDVQSGRLRPAVSRLYFAAFQSACAALSVSGREYGKHSAVRAAFHRDFVDTGVVPLDLGVTYSQLFDRRHSADYQPLSEFDADFDTEIIAGFTTSVERLLVLFSQYVDRVADEPKANP